MRDTSACSGDWKLNRTRYYEIEIEGPEGLVAADEAIQTDELIFKAAIHSAASLQS
jgi:hypothetical protein